ncbi:Hydroxylaminobenzene mutase HabA [Nymphon striatum]|nr:Hydroxylaminobenzene mutase HabA [Nymphon striatum]
MDLNITLDGIHLIQAGAILFVLGLLQGVVIPIFKNSRMALSAHLTALQSAMALMIFGIIWKLIALDADWLVLMKWCLIISIYLIWAGITLAACNGASKVLPIAGSGFSASRTAELTVTILEVIGGVLILFACILIVVGLFNH